MQTGRLDLRQLTVLREVARRGSFAAAAEALGLTPSAVSQQMAKLEQRTGSVLFERLGRGTRLSAPGAAFLAHAEAIIDRLDDAELELRSLAAGRGGRLRIGSFPTATSAFVASALESFRERFPGVSLHLVDGEPFESAGRLARGELDLAVLFELRGWPATRDYDGDAVCGCPELVCAELFDDAFLVVMPSDHPLAAREKVALAELATERIIGSPRQCPPWGADLLAACTAAGVDPVFDDSYRSIDFTALQAVVATGRGVTLMPRLALAHLRDDLCARPLEQAPVRHVRIARRVDSPSTCIADAMEGELRRAAGVEQRGPFGGDVRLNA